MLTPNALDPSTVDRHFRQLEAAVPGAAAPQEFVAREAERRLLPRLEPIRLDPARWIVDVGCGRCQVHAELLQRFAGARIVGIDRVDSRLPRTGSAAALPGGPMQALRRTWQRLRRSLDLPAPALPSADAHGGAAASRPPQAGTHWLVGDAHALPLSDACADMVWCSTAAHWFVDPVLAIREWRRVLRPGGLVVFSALGPGSFAGVGERAGPDWPVFQDMHDWGDALLNAGFAAPVMESERVDLSYADDTTLAASRDERMAADLRACVPLNAGVPLEGIVQLPVEFVFGHAWVPEGAPARSGESPLRFVRDAGREHAARPPGAADGG